MYLRGYRISAFRNGVRLLLGSLLTRFTLTCVQINMLTSLTFVRQAATDASSCAEACCKLAGCAVWNWCLPSGCKNSDHSTCWIGGGNGKGKGDWTIKKDCRYGSQLMVSREDPAGVHRSPFPMTGVGALHQRPLSRTHSNNEIYADVLNSC